LPFEIPKSNRFKVWKKRREVKLHAMKVRQGGKEVQHHSLLSSELDGDKWLIYPSLFTSGKGTPVSIKERLED
jgi:hypothetical protein